MLSKDAINAEQEKFANRIAATLVEKEGFTDYNAALERAKDMIEKNEPIRLRHDTLGRMTEQAQNSAFLSKTADYGEKKMQTREALEAYREINEEFFQSIVNFSQKEGLKKVQSGADLSTHVQSLDKGFTYHRMTKNNVTKSYQEVLADLQNFKKASHFGAFDIETLSGVGKTGQNQIDMMSDFAMQVMDPSGALVKGYDTSVGIPQGKLGEALEIDLRSLIDDIENRGFVTDRHRIIGERLAMDGHSEASLDLANNIIRPVGQDKVRGTDTNLMRRGLERRLELGRHQDQIFKAEGVYPWEKTMIGAFEHATSNQGMVQSYHGTGFDFPAMQKHISQYGSPTGKKRLKELIAQAGDRHLDVFQVNQYMEHDAFARMFGPQAIDTIRKKNLKIGSQEALATAFGIDTGDAHVALHDTITLGRITTNKMAKGLGGGTWADYALDNIKNPGDFTVPLKGGGNTLFLSTQSVGPYTKDSTVLSFSHDAFSGEIRSTAGIALGPRGVEKELFEQHVIKKDMTYALGDMGAIRPGDNVAAAIRKAHPQVNTDGLVYFRMDPVFDQGIDGMGKFNHKFQSSQYLVGTPEDVLNQLQKSFLPIGEKNKAGNFEFFKGETGDRIRHLLEDVEVVFDDKGVSQGLRTIHKPSVQDVITRKSKAAVDDLASATRREYTYKQAKGHTEAVRYLEGLVERKIYRDREEAIKDVLEISKNLARGVSTNTIRQGESIQGLQNFLSYGYQGSEKLYREGIDKFLGNYLEVLNNLESLDEITSIAEEAGRGDEKRSAYFFEQIMTKLRDEADTRQFTGSTAVPTSRLKTDVFQLDLGQTMSRANRTGDGILSVPLTGSDYGPLTKVMQLTGTKDPSDKDAIKLLTDTHDRLFDLYGKEAGLEKPASHIYKRPDLLSRQVLSDMQKVRGVLPHAGYVKEFTEHQMAGAVPYKELFGGQKGYQEVLGRIRESVMKEDVTFLTDDNVRAQSRRFSEGLFHAPSIDDLKRMGYSGDPLNQMMSSIDIKRKGHQRVYEELFEGFHKAGINIGIEDNRVFAFTPGEAKADITKYLPTQTHHDGISGLRVGGSRVSNALSLRMEGGELIFGSHLEDAMKGTYGGKMGFIEQQAKHGRGVDATVGFLKKFNENLRKGPQLNRGDYKDARAAHQIKLGNLLDFIPRLVDGKLLDPDTIQSVGPENRPDLQKEYTNVLRGVLRKTPEDMKNLKIQEQIVLRFNLPTILKSYKGTSLERDFPWIDSITPTTKDSTLVDFTYEFAAQSAWRPGEGSAKQARGVNWQDATGMAFDRDRVEAYVKGAKKGGLSWNIGRAVDTPVSNFFASRQLTALAGNKTSTTVTGEMIDISDGALRHTVADYLKRTPGTKSDALFRNRIDLMSVAESGSVTNPRLLDKAFNQHTSLQRIKLNEVYNVQNMTEEMMIKGQSVSPVAEMNRQNKLLPKVTVGKNGAIHVGFSKGDVVHRGEGLILKTKDGAPDIIGADYDGLLKFGFSRRSDGQMMDEAAINRFIQKNKLHEQIKEDQDIIRVLTNYTEKGERVFTGQFYVDPFELKLDAKYILNNTEKTMGDSMMVGLGMRDPRVRDTLKGMDMETFQGKVLKQEHLQDMVRDRFHSGIKGFDDSDSLLRAMELERYSDWDRFVTDVLGMDDPENLLNISSSFAEEYKHGEVTGTIQRFGEGLREHYRKEGLSPEEANRAMLADMQRVVGAGATLDGNTVVMPSDAEFNLKAMRGLMDEKGLRETLHTLPSGAKVHKYRGNIQRLNDPTNMKYLNAGEVGNRLLRGIAKGSSLDDAGLHTLGVGKYDQETLDSLRAAMGDKAFKENFGNIDISTHQGRRIADGVIHELNENRMVTPGMDRVMDGGQIARGLTGRDERLLRNLKEASGITNVTGDRFEDYKALLNTAAAIDFNEKARITNQDELQEHLKRVRVPTKEAGILHAREEIFDGQNVVLDLKTANLDERALGGRYLEIPGYPVKNLHDDKPITNEVQQRVSKLRYQIEAYEDRLTEGNFSPEQRADAEKAIRETVEATRKDISNLGFGKEGHLGSFRKFELPGQRKKMQLLNVNMENADQLKGMTFQGQALHDYYKGKQAVNFSIADESFFDDILKNKRFLERTGMTEESLKERLRTEGTLGMDYRHPGVYTKSLSPNMMYLSQDKNLQPGQIRTSAAAAAAKAGDADGDTASYLLLKSRAKIYHEGKVVEESITNMEYQMYKQANVRVELLNPEAFKSAQQKIHYDAMTTGHFIDQLSNQEKFAAQLKLDPGFEPEYSPFNEKYLREVATKHGTLVGDTMKSQTHRQEAQLADALAKINKGFAGYINHSIAGLRLAVGGEEGPAGQAGEGAWAVLTGMEERFLTPKKSGAEALEDMNMIDELNEAFTDLYVRKKGKEPLINWGEKYLIGDVGDDPARKELGKSFPRFEKARELLTSDKGRPMIREFADFAERVDQRHPDIQRLLQMGNTSMNQINPELAVSMKGDMTASGVMQVGRAMYKEGWENISAVDSILKGESDALAGGMTDARAKLFQEKAMQRSQTERAMSAISDLGTRVSGKHLAIGAAGVAGAIMGAAFVGGRAPAGDDQAMAYSQENMYHIPLMSDEMTNLNQNPHQGYVINVNARSRKNEKQMQDIIQGSMQQNFGTNINISMNTRTENGNIMSDKEIERLIEGAFR